MFRDEDLAYALRPGQAGVPVEFHLHPGAPHEFDFIAFNTTAAGRAIADRIQPCGSFKVQPLSSNHGVTALETSVSPQAAEALADQSRHQLGRLPLGR